MYKNQSIINSFKNAVNGIVFAICEERNMRIAMSFVLPILVYSFFAKLSKYEFAAVIICICIVFVTELLNSSVENAIDCCITEKNPLAGKAKDMGAGATLIASVMSAAVGIIVLYKPDKLKEFIFIFKNPVYSVVAILYVIACCFFVFRKNVTNNI